MTTPLPDDFDAPVGAPDADAGSTAFADALPGMDSFENPGEVINQGRGPHRDRTGDSFFAYSTILARGLRSQADTLIEFIKTAALKTDLQMVCVDRLASWFEWQFNAPACNRYGMLAFTRNRIETLVDQLEDIADEAEREQARADIESARELAQQYTAARAQVILLEGRSTRGMEREDVERLEAEREQALQEMVDCDQAAAKLSPSAREIYGHDLYMRWVEDWIAADERAGLPVAKYDYTDLKRRLAKKEINLLDCLDDLPLPLQKAYQLCQVSLSSGEQWRQMFVLGITNGYGVMPPEDDSGKKKWYDRFTARQLSSHGRDRRSRERQ